jgi:hypothetical protein
MGMERVAIGYLFDSFESVVAQVRDIGRFKATRMGQRPSHRLSGQVCGVIEIGLA